LVAEAQSPTIQPTGPLAVHVADPSEVYTATVTTNYSFWFYLWVYNNGTNVYGGQWYIVNSGPSYNFTSPVLSTSTWGLAVGNVIDFKAKASISPTRSTIVDLYDTVQSGGTSMGPKDALDAMLAAALPSRKDREIDELIRGEDGTLA
jgi:hypothetical protein